MHIYIYYSTYISTALTYSRTHIHASLPLPQMFCALPQVRDEKLEVTDDVSVIEALGLPVKLTLGQYSNIKLTTPGDLQIAEQILRDRGVKDEGSYPCPSERYRDSLTQPRNT